MLLALTVANESIGSEVACSQSARQIFRDAGPSVVRVVSIAIDPFSLAKRVRQGVGSGVVIEGDKIITNAHIVYEASEILIAMDDGTVFQAVVVGLDEISDLAIIRPDGATLPVPPAKLAESRSVDVGTDVLAIGYPFGLEKSISKGIVSGKGRVLPFTPTSWLTPLIQTDAAVNPGNSGGALVNLCGEVVGINTLASKRGQNVNFAIPIALVLELMPDLLEHGRVIRPWHGVYGRPVPPILQYTVGLPPGFLIETIEPGSPAESIGLRGGTFPVVIGLDEYLLGGDIIREVNGTALTDMDTVMRVVRGFRVGDRLNLKYWREGMIREAMVVLPERPVLTGDGFRFREQ
jgi:S1-C subfamily serine protease